MNRAERRALYRRITRELHVDFGCTCQPSVAPLTDQLGRETDRIRDAIGGHVFDTLHEDGCPLGAMGATAIEQGVVLYGRATTPLRGCAR